MATAFETEMGVIPELSRAVQEMDWILPTDIQSEAVPLILGGGDVLMAAETGSGKTGAFCLPILQVVYETLKEQEEGKKSKRAASSGGVMVSKVWKMNVYDRDDAMAVDTEEGLLCQSRSQNWCGIRANKGVRGSGKFYFEAIVTDDGLCRVGWSTIDSPLNLGTKAKGYGFGGTGKKSYNGQFDDYGESFCMEDVIGCLLNLENGDIRWSKNGIDLGKAYEMPKALRDETWYPACVLKNAEMKFNFGGSPFKYEAPLAGYQAVSLATKVCVNSPKGAVLTPGASGGKISKAPLAIIIEPSRELAEQTYQMIDKFQKYLPDPKITKLLIIGGGDTRNQSSTLEHGVHMVVATPGRLDDLINGQVMSPLNCRFLVLDECDGLLQQGHGQFIDRLHASIPKVTSDGKRLQMIVCSATLHSFDVKKMADRLMSFPAWIDLKGQDSVPETVHHLVCVVDPQKDTSWKQLISKKRRVVTDAVHARDNINPNYESAETASEAVKILKGEYVVKAITEHKMDKALIFCRTKLDCDNLENYFNLLDREGGKQARFSCVCLHSDRNPGERKANLDRFKEGKANFLICTDVAARGIDIKGLPYVINVTLPDMKENYIHRIGRVGRADRMGLAISLVAAVKEKVWYHSNCKNKGVGCTNTNLTDRGGCCIWYNENQLLADVEEHLGVTIDQVENDFKIQTSEYAGKIIYGQKAKAKGFSDYTFHTDMLVPSLKTLVDLEKRSQDAYLLHKYSNMFA